MREIRHWLSSHLRTIVIVVIFIIILLGFWAVLKSNFSASLKEDNQNILIAKEVNGTYQMVEKTNEEKEDIFIQKEKKQEEQEKDIIDIFVDYCNTRDIESAYNMLSTDCKQELYPSIEVFRDNYVYTNFDSAYKMARKMEVIGNSVKVELYVDALATGVLDGSHIYSQYITVVTENGEKKLNVNSYIGETVLDEDVGTVEGIKATLVSKKVYADYVIVNLEIENTTEKTIAMDPKRSARKISIAGEDIDHTYYAITDENTAISLIYEPHQKKNLHIKFYKAITQTTQTKAIVFSDVILDYEGYKSSSEKSKFPGISIGFKTVHV